MAELASQPISVQGTPRSACKQGHLLLQISTPTPKASLAICVFGREVLPANEQCQLPVAWRCLNVKKGVGLLAPAELKMAAWTPSPHSLLGLCCRVGSFPPRKPMGSPGPSEGPDSRAGSRKHEAGSGQLLESSMQALSDSEEAQLSVPCCLQRLHTSAEHRCSEAGRAWRDGCQRKQR